MKRHNNIYRDQPASKHGPAKRQAVRLVRALHNFDLLIVVVVVVVSEVPP